jgi:SOS-response transcriptional repressor LexA
LEAYEIIQQLLLDKDKKGAEIKNRIEAIIGKEIPKGTYYHYLQGIRSIPQHLKVPFAKALDVPVSVIFQDEETIDFIREFLKKPTSEVQKIVTKQFSNFENVISIPVFEAVAGCGASGMLEQLKLNNAIDIDRKILPKDLINKDLALIRVVGDSMEPYLSETDWAFIQLRHNQDIVLANSVYLIAHGDNVQIKRCQFKPDGSCLLISDNKTYPDEIAYFGEWDIVGKIVGRFKFGSGFELKDRKN